MLVSAIVGTPISAPFAGAVTEPVGSGVVDADGDRGGGEGVAGVVGGDDAEVVLAVGRQRGVQLAAWFVQVPAPAGERWNWTVATPEPASAELLVSAIVPRTFARRDRAR